MNYVSKAMVAMVLLRVYLSIFFENIYYLLDSNAVGNKMGWDK